MLILDRVARLTLLVAVAALFGNMASDQALADNHKGGDRASRWSPDAMFDRADADGDGNVSREEFHNALKKRMERMKAFRSKMKEKLEEKKGDTATATIKSVPAKKLTPARKHDHKHHAKRGHHHKKGHHAKRGHHAHKKGHHGHRGHHAKRAHKPHSMAMRAMRHGRPAISPGSIGVINAKVVNIHYHFGAGSRAHGLHRLKAAQLRSKAAKCGKVRASKCGKSKCSKKACSKSKCSKSGCSKSKCSKAKKCCGADASKCCGSKAKKCCGKCGGKAKASKACPFCLKGKRAELESKAAEGLVGVTADSSEEVAAIDDEQPETISFETIEFDLRDAQGSTEEAEAVEEEAPATESTEETADSEITEVAGIDFELDEAELAAAYGIDVAELILDEIVNQ